MCQMCQFRVDSGLNWAFGLTHLTHRGSGLTHVSATCVSPEPASEGEQLRAGDTVDGWGGVTDLGEVADPAEDLCAVAVLGLLVGDAGEPECLGVSLELRRQRLRRPRPPLRDAAVHPVPGGGRL